MLPIKGSTCDAADGGTLYSVELWRRVCEAVSLPAKVVTIMALTRSNLPECVDVDLFPWRDWFQRREPKLKCRRRELMCVSNVSQVSQTCVTDKHGLGIIYSWIAIWLKHWGQWPCKNLWPADKSTQPWLIGTLSAQELPAFPASLLRCSTSYFMSSSFPRYNQTASSGRDPRDRL